MISQKWRESLKEDKEKENLLERLYADVDQDLDLFDRCLAQSYSRTGRELDEFRCRLPKPPMKRSFCSERSAASCSNRRTLAVPLMDWCLSALGVERTGLVGRLREVRGVDGPRLIEHRLIGFSVALALSASHGRRFADLRRDESRRGSCRQVAGGSRRLLLSEQVILRCPAYSLALYRPVSRALRSTAPHVSGSVSASTCRRGTTKIAFESPAGGSRYYLLS
jgi:hypothetical protein